MVLESFAECLFRQDETAEQELDEAVDNEGSSKLAPFVVTVLREWKVYAQGLTHEDQNMALWRIIGHPLAVYSWLADTSELSLSQKLDLIRAARHVTLAIPSLFGERQPMETGYYMLWDSLAPKCEEPELANECLEILEGLCLESDFRVQTAALHGLGHLSHPDRPAVVDEYIRRHPELKDDPWLLKCREGTVM